MKMSYNWKCIDYQIGRRDSLNPLIKSVRILRNQGHYLDMLQNCEFIEVNKTFMRDKNVTFDDTYTVDEFIALCENSYGGKIIKELKERWNCRNGSD